LAIPADATNEHDCRRAADATLGALGRIDALVSNAFQQPPFEPLVDQANSTIKDSLDVNLFAALNMSRAVADTMRQQRSGCIVMVNSAILRHTRELFGAYKMGKFALLALAQSLATELGPDGIRVNSIAPGFIWDDAVRGFLQHTADQRGIAFEEMHEELLATHPLRRIPTPDEIADTVVLLASPLARAVTGQCLDVNAGEYFH
jgi:NAD(P)-dependent dehydrogenase (short-subunit alcohol dehydrogenase family)